MRYEQHPYFEFSFLEKFGITPEQVKLFSENNYNKFISLCKNKDNMLCMTRDMNTEWVFRSYYATKMIMSATLLLNNADYCISKNIMVPVPYLLYYAAFTSARGFIYASPFTAENDLDKLVNASHQKVLNIVSDLIKKHVDREIGNKTEMFLNYLRDQRELFSYKFPASGITDKIDFEGTVDICGLLAELTELSSYKIQEVFEKKFINDSACETNTEPNWMSFNEDLIKKSYTYESKGTIEEHPRIDYEDLYRIDYIQRKVKYPTSVLFTMREGMTEDFFGSWCSSDNADGDNFNPDLNWNRIFPIP